MFTVIYRGYSLFTYSTAEPSGDTLVPSLLGRLNQQSPPSKSSVATRRQRTLPSYLSIPYPVVEQLGQVQNAQCNAACNP